VTGSGRCSYRIAVRSSRLSDDKGLSAATNGPAELSRFVGRTSVKAASVGAVRNSSLPRANRALYRIDLVSCQHGLLHSGEARSVAGRAGMLFDLRRHDEPFSSRPLSFVQLTKWPPCGLRTKTILVAPVTKLSCRHARAVQFLISFLNSNRERSNKASRGTVRTSCIDAGDITIRIDERHVSDFAQYPPGLSFTMEPRGGVAAGLPDQEDAK